MSREYGAEYPFGSGSFYPTFTYTTSGPYAHTYQAASNNPYQTLNDTGPEARGRSRRPSRRSDTYLDSDTQNDVKGYTVSNLYSKISTVRPMWASLRRPSDSLRSLLMLGKSHGLSDTSLQTIKDAKIDMASLEIDRGRTLISFNSYNKKARAIMKTVSECLGRKERDLPSSVIAFRNHLFGTVERAEQQ
jgi:hypothetical protein